MLLGACSRTRHTAQLRPAPRHTWSAALRKPGEHSECEHKHTHTGCRHSWAFYAHLSLSTCALSSPWTPFRVSLFICAIHIETSPSSTLLCLSSFPSFALVHSQSPPSTYFCHLHPLCILHHCKSKLDFFCVCCFCTGDESGNLNDG